MPHYVASDLGLHCLPMTLLRVSKEEWVKICDDYLYKQPYQGGSNKGYNLHLKY